MSELERLNEALEAWGPFDPYEPVDDGLRQIQRMTIADAARAYRDLLANGQRVRWCEVHDSQAHLPPQPEGDEPDGLEGSDQDICLHSMIVSASSPCRIVFQLLSVYPKEAENETR